MSPDNLKLRSALRYAELGWPVLPALGRGATVSYKEASTDPKQIDEWWLRWPRANVASPTGVCYWVLDVDVRDEIDGWSELLSLQMQHGKLPNAPCVLTPRKGYHYYFRHIDGLPSVDIADGIESFGVGKYAILPPSSTDAGEYVWDGLDKPNLIDLPEAPLWLVDMIWHPRDKAKPVRTQIAVNGTIPDGMRHDFLLQEAARVRAQGASNEELRMAVAAANEICDPPKPAREIRQIAAWFENRNPGMSDEFAAQLYGGMPAVEEEAPNDVIPEPVEPVRPRAKPVVVSENPVAAKLVIEPSLYDPASWKGDTKPNHSSAAARLETLDEFTKSVYYDEFANQITLDNDVYLMGCDAVLSKGRMDDGKLNMLLVHMQRMEGINFKREHVKSAVEFCAFKHQRHPLRDWLKSLQWDGIDRLSTMASTYLPIDTRYSTPSTANMMMRAWMLGAVARAMLTKDGTVKMDNMLVLESESGGVGKNKFFAALGGPFFCLFTEDLRSRDAYIILQGKWIVLMDEFNRIYDTQYDHLLRFCTSPEDRYRDIWGTGHADRPRQCVIGGSVNQSAYVNDDMAARRFWPIRIDHKKEIDVDRVAEDRDQLFAQALIELHAGEKWYWSEQSDEAEMVRVDMVHRMIWDAWQEDIIAWIRKEVEQNGCVFNVGGYPGVGVDDIQEKCLKLKKEYKNKRSAARVGDTLRRIGLQRERNTKIRSNGAPQFIWVVREWTLDNLRLTPEALQRWRNNQPQ